MRTLHFVVAGLSRRWRAVLPLLAVVLACGAQAGADDDVLYAGGKAYPLVVSTTEFGVKLQEGDTGPSVASEMGLQGIGTLEDLGAGRSRYRLLRVGAANTQTRDLARTVPGVEWVRPVYRAAGLQSPLLCTGELLARVRPGMSDAQARDLFSGFGLNVVREFNGLHDTYVLALDDDLDGDVVARAAELYQDGRIVYSHPNFAAESVPRQVATDDEYFSQQWHLNNTGQGGGTAGADISVLDAWTVTQGENVRIGMLDDSCDIDHEDLRSNYLNVGQDINDGDQDPRPAQIGDRHGTAVMGLICAAGNDVGVRGVAPNARFTATRGLGFTTLAEVASAYTFARQQDVDVHNNSWGYIGLPAPPDIVADAIRTAFEEGRDGKGMVVLFASGNEGREAPEDISGLPTVIAVGSTNANDIRSSYSNYGPHLEVMAPSNFGEEVITMLPSMVTTDNTDDAGYAEPGYNFGGFDDWGMPNLSNPDYTKDFGGTSAACPVAAGVAALILSVNDELTATQVRVILEHTANNVSPADAAYDGVTGHSNLYGYGRINANAAVATALESVDNGNLTWPDRVSNVRVTGDTLRWASGSETENMVIVAADGIFQWVPADGTTYQLGEEVTPGVTVVFKDVGGEVESYEFEPPEFGTTYFAIFAQNNLGRYSWGVLVDSDGNVTGAGPADTGDGGDQPGDSILPIYEEPKVSVDVSPRSGESPLTVTFKGNALTDSEIASTTWDFGDDSPTDSQRETTHTYEVTGGTTKQFIATFTVVDEEGDVGERSVAVEVSSGAASGDGGGSSGNVQVILTDTTGQPFDTGFAPLDVQLTVETADLPGAFNSIHWDLGDGTTADTLTVLHTYQTPGTWWITAQVTTCHPTSGCRTTTNPNGVTWQMTSPPEFITVLASSSGLPPPPDQDQDNEFLTEPGNLSLSTGHDASGSACGIGLMPLWLGMLGLAAIRRWVR